MLEKNIQEALQPGICLERKGEHGGRFAACDSEGVILSASLQKGKIHMGF
jgi:hypothetical protein